MPNVIITPAFAAIRARAKSDQYNALAAGVQDTSNIVAQALLVYSQRKREEENAKFQLLDKTIERYGEQADQGMLSEYDKLLRRRGGFGLPKDDQGRLKPIPPQNELELLRKEMGAGTPEAQEAAANYVAKRTTGMSKVQQHFEAAKEAETQRYHHALEEARALSATASMMRAKMMGLRGLQASAPSGLIRNPDGTLVNDQGQGLEPGQVQLNVAQAKADYNKRQIEQLGVMREVGNRVKEQDVKVKELTISNELMYGSAKGLLPLIDMRAKGILPKDMEAAVDKGIREVLMNNGITEPKEQKGWIARIIQGYVGLPDEVKHDALQHASVPDEHGLTIVPAPKEGSEIAPGVIYRGTVNK